MTVHAKVLGVSVRGSEAFSADAILETLPVAAAIFGPDLACLNVNRYLSEMIGIPELRDPAGIPGDMLRPLTEALAPALRQVLDGCDTAEVDVTGEILGPASRGQHFRAVLRSIRADGAAAGVTVWLMEATPAEGSQKPQQRQTAVPEALKSVDALERLLNGVPDPVLVKDCAHRWLVMNDALCALMGRSREEMLGRTDHDFLPKHQADGYWAVDDDVFATGEEREVEEELTAADGTVFVLKTRKRLVRLQGADGEEAFLIASVNDITPLRHALTALRESEEHYRHTIELSPQIHWTADPDGMITHAASRWCDMTGMTQEEMLGTGWARALHPDDLDATHQAWTQATRSGDPLDIEYRVRNAHGTYRWFRAYAAPRRDADGRIIRWYGMVEEIHDRKQAEMAVRESEIRFRTMADDAPVIIWVTDSSGANIFSNRLWRETTGQTEEEARGTGWMKPFHPDDLAAIYVEYLAAQAERRRFRGEHRLRRADGSWAWVMLTAQPRFAADGTFLGYTGSTIDISERRAMEAALRESEVFARSILDRSPDGITVLDLNGHIQFMNAAGCQLLGIEDHEPFVGQSWRALLATENDADVAAALAVAEAGQPGQVIAHRVRPGDTAQWLDVSTATIPDAQGRPARLLAIWRDVSEARRARDEVEQARQQAEQAAARLTSVLESTMDSVFVLDHEARLTYLNSNASRLLAPRHPRLGASIWELFPEEAEGAFGRHYRRALAQQAPLAFEEHLAALDLWLEVQAYPTAEGMSVFFRDVTERRRAEQERLIAQEKIVHMARHDALTGLPNRLLFREHLEGVLAERRKASAVAVLYLDLDGFKAVNDTLGHPAGDALLRLVAERLRRCVRGSDTVARFGGDEFAIVQSNVTRQEDAACLARRVVEALADPFDLDGHPVAIGTSVGIAVAAEDADSPDYLLKAADIALYRAKADGRGVHRFFEPGMDSQLEARQAIKLAIRGALSRNEFMLHYQPLIHLGSGRISGFEALLRWKHPERGMISPADFIPLAEETGLIVPIGEWALQEACRTAAAWPDDVSIAVNLSPVQFRSKSLVDTVARALTASRLPPPRLQLEITESVLLQDNAANLQLLQELRGLGVRIAMDDFGTGYSSLSYLRRFPFDKIKLDRSFVSDLPTGLESCAIARAVAGLASGLGMTITAEGIETAEQFEALRKKGYDEGQGYLFSRPVPAAEARLLIERSHFLGMKPAA